jgi:thiamine kinase-like enzyme
LHFVLGNCSLSIDESHTLHIALKELPVQLNRLYEEFPITLTHNDYNAKNLMVCRNSIVPIDWSNAYLSPHLGDLYCLISEAQKYGIEKSVIVEAYREHDHTELLDWQIQVGGICWLIRSLRWVCEEGIHKVPGTDKWVLPLILAIRDCMEQLCE